jgi:hypothetical protein
MVSHAKDWATSNPKSARIFTISSVVLRSGSPLILMAEKSAGREIF